MLPQAKDIKLDEFPYSDWVAYRYPQVEYSQGMSIISGISQVALIFKDGNLISKIESERKLLPQQLLALLEYYILKKSSIDLDVYYFRTSYFNQVKWGVSVNLTHNILKCYGNCIVRVSDYELFLHRVIGSKMNHGAFFSEKALKEFLYPMINAGLHSIVNEYQTLQISELLPHIKEKFHINFQTYGLELCDFILQSYNIINA